MNGMYTHSSLYVSDPHTGIGCKLHVERPIKSNIPVDESTHIEGVCRINPAVLGLRRCFDHGTATGG
jgi:hypothetical protein